VSECDIMRLGGKVLMLFEGRKNSGDFVCVVRRKKYISDVPLVPKGEDSAETSCYFSVIFY